MFESIARRRPSLRPRSTVPRIRRRGGKASCARDNETHRSWRSFGVLPLHVFGGLAGKRIIRQRFVDYLPHDALLLADALGGVDFGQSILIANPRVFVE